MIRRMGFACEMKSDTFPLVKKNRAAARNRRKVSLNQTILPLIPQGATSINSRVGVFNEGGHWVYLLGMHPIYRHRAGDQRGFRLTIAQLVDSQTCRAAEVCEALGIAKSQMDRALRLYRAGGIEAFFERKLTRNGHQVSLIGTAYQLESDELAAALFSRWCQENFFRYSMQHFDIDSLGEYETTPLHDTEKVINPAWRDLERQRNALENKLRYRRAHYAGLSLHAIDASEEKKYRQAERRKAELLEEIMSMEAQLAEVKARKKKTRHHITWAELDEADRFEKPVLGRKRLLDAVRMIAYRAETALCSLARSATIDNAAARQFLQVLFVTDADIRPDPAAGILHVEIHRGSRPVTDRTLSALLTQLNEMEIIFPGTELIMRYALLGSPPAVSP